MDIFKFNHGAMKDMLGGMAKDGISGGILQSIFSRAGAQEMPFHPSFKLPIGLV